MGDKLKEHIALFLTTCRHTKSQTIIMCHKPSQIDNNSRGIANVIHVASYKTKDWEVFDFGDI